MQVTVQNMSNCAVCKRYETAHGITVVERTLDASDEDVYYESELSIAVFFPVTDTVTDARLCTECYETDAYLK